MFLTLKQHDNDQEVIINLNLVLSITLKRSSGELVLTTLNGQVYFYNVKDYDIYSFYHDLKRISELDQKKITGER